MSYRSGFHDRKSPNSPSLAWGRRSRYLPLGRPCTVRHRIPGRPSKHGQSNHGIQIGFDLPPVARATLTGRGAGVSLLDMFGIEIMARSLLIRPIDGAGSWEIEDMRDGKDNFSVPLRPPRFPPGATRQPARSWSRGQSAWRRDCRW
jgi:hypothetical protein